MDKILVSAATLQQIFKAHPEVEVELVSSATAQIAGRVAEKLKVLLPNATKQIEAAFQAQITGIKSSTRLHPEVKALIREFIAEQCAAEIKAQLAKEVTEQALVRVNELTKAQMMKVEELLKAQVNVATINFYTEIKKMAEDEFIKLVRNVNLGGKS